MSSAAIHLLMSSSGTSPHPPPNASTLSAKKKPRPSLPSGLPELESVSQRSLLPTLPLELLAEILIQTNSPRDVLAVARTSKFFCSTLVCNPAANFIWRAVRKKCLPCSLPDPTPNFGEAAYAAFVYDGGLCEMCGKNTNEFYVSFAARIRLCRDPRCRKDFIAEYLVDVNSIFKGRARDAIWIFYVESTRCFAQMSFISIAWPDNPTVLMRKSEWERFQANHAAFSAPTSSEELRKACTDQIARFPKVMELAVALQKWKYSYGAMHRTIKGKNEAWAKALARREGWNVHDLLNCQSYGSLHRCKTSVLEEVTLCNFLAIKALVEVQLLKMQEHRQNRQNEASYRQRRDDVGQYYNRLRSAGTIVPSLSEFRKLPVMKTVQGSVTGPRPNSRGLALDLKKSGLVAELVTADLKQWMEPVRERLSELLGFPRWKSASKTKLHPLDRVTAWFRCQRCGNVSKRYKAERCLDLTGVCAHECPNHGHKAVDWSVGWFVKDEKASNAVTRILTLTGITDEDATARDIVKDLGARIRCLSCEHALIVMDFPTLIGHSHRHDDMQVAILPAGEALEHAFESGLSAELMDTNFRAKKKRSEAIYRCRHCVLVGELAVGDEEGQVSREEPIAKASQNEDKRRKRNKKSKFRPVDFNALRSHLKGQHRIEMVSDEDFFAQPPMR